MECEVDLAEGYLQNHHKTQNGAGWGSYGGAHTHTHIHTHPKEAHHYLFSFSKTLYMIFCLVEGCQVWATIWNNLQVHFVHRHMSYTLVILEEVIRPHPDAPNSIFLCSRWTSTTSILPYRSAGGGRNTNATGWRQNRLMWGKICPSLPMGNPLHQYPT